MADACDFHDELVAKGRVLDDDDLPRVIRNGRFSLLKDCNVAKVPEKGWFAVQSALQRRVLAAVFYLLMDEHDISADV